MYNSWKEGNSDAQGHSVGQMNLGRYLKFFLDFSEKHYMIYCMFVDVEVYIPYSNSKLIMIDDMVNI